MKMFSTDEEIHNQESQQIMLPIWVPILVSVLTGFAMGIGKSQNYFSFAVWPTIKNIFIDFVFSNLVGKETQQRNFQQL